MFLKLGAGALALALGLSGYVVTNSGSAARKGESGAAASMAAKPGAQTAGMLPSRFLDCTLRRIVNFDPSKVQKPSDFEFEGQHDFRLFLPSIPVRTTPPPEAPLPADPVDPKTRIVSDPDGLAQEAQGKAFDRVVDLWPDRVEMTTPISTVAVNLIILDRINASAGTAAIFMTKANDAVTYDLKHLYYGQCHFSIGGNG